MARSLSTFRRRRLSAHSVEESERWLEAIGEFLRVEQPLGNEEIFRASVLVAELCSNAWRHGAAAKLCVDVKVINDSILQLFFTDDGIRFDMGRGGELPSSLYAESGRGLFLIGQLADSSHYRRRGNTNVHMFTLIRGDALGSAISSERNSAVADQ